MPKPGVPLENEGEESESGMDPEELKELLEQLHPASYGWALCRCRWNHEEAEEVLQTAYLKILQGKAKYDGKSSLKTWMFALIKRTASEMQRKSYWRNLRIVDFFQRNTAALIRNGVEHLDERHEMMSALRRLSPRQREVLELVFYQDLTLEEAAVVMKLSVGTVRTHYERGKQILRKELRQKEVR